MGDVTPKKKKDSKKSKRKSNELLSPITPGSSEHINGVKGESDRKKHKKDKKNKDKKKDRKSGALLPDNVVSHHERKTHIETTSEQPTVPNVQQITPTPQAGSSSMFSIISSTSTNATKNSPYQIKSLEGTVALLPTSLSDVPKRIRTLLHSLLLMYDTTMGGVLLSLDDNLKMLPLKGGLIGGRIMDDLPYVHYRFQVNGMVFCPKVGMKVSICSSFANSFLCLYMD